MEKRTEKIAAAIIRNGDKILATQRGSGHFKGGWEFPGGHVEEGETSEEAAIREIQEELITEIEIDEFLGTIEYDYPDWHLSMDCFLCTIKSGELVLTEHLDAKWLSINELDTVEWLPANIDFIKVLRKRMEAF